MLLGLFVKQGKSHGTGVSILLASLDHTLNTQTLTKTDERKKGFKYIYSFVLGHIRSHPGPRAARRPGVAHPDRASVK